MLLVAWCLGWSVLDLLGCMVVVCGSGLYIGHPGANGRPLSSMLGQRGASTILEVSLPCLVLWLSLFVLDAMVAKRRCTIVSGDHCGHDMWLSLSRCG